MMPDGRIAAVGSGVVRVWNPARSTTPQEIRTEPLNLLLFSTLCALPDGRLVVAGTSTFGRGSPKDTVLVVRHPDTDAEPLDLQHPTEFAGGRLVSLEDGRIATESHDHSILGLGVAGRHRTVDPHRSHQHGTQPRTAARPAHRRQCVRRVHQSLGDTGPDVMAARHSSPTNPPTRLNVCPTG